MDPPNWEKNDRVGVIPRAAKTQRCGRDFQHVSAFGVDALQPSISKESD